MRRMKISVLMAILVVLVTFAFAITTDAIIMKNQQVNSISEQKNIVNSYSQQSLFDAEITFYVYEGEGCGCVPITGATILATGGDGSDSGVTDEEGKCILHLVINVNGEYGVSINAEGYNTVLFDFNVIGDQKFIFHLGEKEGSSLNEESLFYKLIRQVAGEIYK